MDTDARPRVPPYQHHSQHSQGGITHAPVRRQQRVRPHPIRNRSRIVRLALALAFLGALLPMLSNPAVSTAASTSAVPCSTSGSWTAGEVTVYWFDVEQGDSQLIVGPAGKTLLIDLGETAYNSYGTNTKAYAVAEKIRSICGTGASPVALDYVVASHHHLDHIGYAGNPGDTSNYGNGLYQLLTPSSLGGLGFTVGTLIDRDAGTWSDANNNGTCEVGTSANPSNEIAWHNAGTTSQTARRFICWLYGPPGQADRATIEGHVLTLRNDDLWPGLDLGSGVTVAIVNANGKDTMQADGVTPVSGDHTQQGGDGPPSENDYSIALEVSYGKWNYATAGDSDGEYNVSSYNYTYNDIEAKIGPLFGNVETMRANHHGSDHSSNQQYIDTLKPETVFISCGKNSYGHPSNRVLDALQQVTNDRGSGADIYLANNPCDPYQSDNTTPTDYRGTLNTNGDVVLRTTDSGNGYTITYDNGTRSYVAYDEVSASPASVVINEYLMAPKSNKATEWIELYNPTSSDVDISGLYLDDVAGGGQAPLQIPAGTIIPARGYYVMDIDSGYLNNTGSESVRYLQIEGGVETVYDETSYNLASTKYDQVFHRIGDGGDWCAEISSNSTKGTANPTGCP